MTPFTYILNRLRKAKIVRKPFAHIQMDDILSPGHFEVIHADPQVTFCPQASEEILRKTLQENAYVPIQFPGCVPTWEEYLDRRDTGRDGLTTRTGITFRVEKPHLVRNVVLRRLLEFLNGNAFGNAVRLKFNITRNVMVSAHLQKQLDGYEVSPHPGIRNKAVTFMLNINPGDDSGEHECHTQLLRFKSKYKSISDFWKTGGQDSKLKERCWIPWEWCDWVKTWKNNNSMLLFAPQSDPSTLHGVKVHIENAEFQRTQLYGNLMIRGPVYDPCEFRDIPAKTVVLGFDQEETDGNEGESAEAQAGEHEEGPGRVLDDTRKPDGDPQADVGEGTRGPDRPVREPDEDNPGSTAADGMRTGAAGVQGSSRGDEEKESEEEPGKAD